MCGIGGIYGQLNLDRETALQKMSTVLRHRGPDAEGRFLDDTCGLFHRRLSIIDPSESANQPFFSKDKRYCIVFNGEIYNYRELKARLNEDFVTTSDTEVVLSAFRQWGPECLNELSGMFAFAVYDTVAKDIFLCRDRLGIKPLYYSFSNGLLCFSSELKGLMASGLFPEKPAVDTAAIQAFLHLGYIPDPATIYQGIRKLPPATWMKVSRQGMQITRWWEAESFARYNSPATETEAEVQLRNLLEQSVRKHMISDVPFGVFLSGGVDSSLVAAIARNQSVEPLTSFTIGFEDPRRDESRHAEAVARHLGTRHHCFRFTWQDAIAKVTEGMDMFDEPFADSSFLPVMLISDKAATQVKMVLTGEGGDELFYGYGAYAWAQRLGKPGTRQLWHQIRPFLTLLGSRGKRVSQLLEPANPGFQRAHLFSQEQYLFSQAEINTLLLPQFLPEYIPADSLFKPVANASPADQQALFDLLYYLPGDLLTKVDRASMHYSLECRVPLLDPGLVEFALSLPLQFKYSEKTWKRLLKKSLYHYLPPELFDRPKQGFSIPLSSWLKQELRYLSDTLLSGETLRQTGILNLNFVNRLKKDFYLQNQTYLYNRIWLLIVLQHWLISHPVTLPTHKP